MRVLDLDHSELLQNPVVEAQLLLLKGWDYFITKVRGKQVIEHLVSDNLAFVLIDLVSHRACIVGILEQGCHCGLSRRYCLEVLLHIAFLTFKSSELLHSFCPCFDGVSDSLDIVELSLYPVVEINVGVAEGHTSLVERDS